MPPVPNTESYVRALRSLRTANRISDVQWFWLRAHFLAPGWALSTMDLAKVAKYESHGGVNLHYGRFGANLATRLGYVVPDGEPFASTFATFSNPDPEAPDTIWHLRPEVVAALEQLNWFPSPPARQSS